MCGVLLDDELGDMSVSRLSGVTDETDCGAWCVRVCEEGGERGRELTLGREVEQRRGRKYFERKKKEE